MEDGASAEIAVVGNEGVVGVALFMGGETTPSRAVVQSAGHGYRLPARVLKEEFDRGGAMQHLLLRYTQALITQMAQTAVCNRHHSVDQQLCRWLLLSLDRLPSNELIMTQELIANMLGVRREGVTEAAGKLQGAGVIRYSRGRITVLDRAEARSAGVRVLRGRAARDRAAVPAVSRGTMELFSGLLDLPWWGHAIAALTLTHVTIAAVTIYLHRHQAHRALELHPCPSHFFRVLAVAHHRHGHQGVGGDPPQAPRQMRDRGGPAQPAGPRHQHACSGGGVLLYVKESNNPDTMERYGHGTPDDWIERNVYTRYAMVGVGLMLRNQSAAVRRRARRRSSGRPRSRGSRSGPRRHQRHRPLLGLPQLRRADASTNIVPWGVLIGGEELHNNHHAYRLRPSCRSKWYEFDIGWLYIRVLEALGLARVKHLAPVPRIEAPRPAADLRILQAVILNRYDVLRDSPVP